MNSKRRYNYKKNYAYNGSYKKFHSNYNIGYDEYYNDSYWYFEKNEYYNHVPYNYNKNDCFSNPTKYNKPFKFFNCAESNDAYKSKKYSSPYNDEDSGNKETWINSKKSQNYNNSDQLIISDYSVKSTVLNNLNKTNLKSEIILEDPLFEHIQNKLDNAAEYTKEELIKDFNALINKNAFIKQFNEYTFIKTDAFQIYDNLSGRKIYLALNLLNFINIINAINYFSFENSKQFLVILDELGINFSYVQSTQQNAVNVVVLTPKSSILYNYISTHGEIAIENEEYKQKIKDFILDDDKTIFDFGYCYEDLSISHLIELIGEGNFKVLPSVMYFVKKEFAEKLVKLDLVKIPKNSTIADPFVLKKDHSGFEETDLIISMLKRVKIQTNFNFREIIKGPLQKEGDIIIFEEGKNYIFEIKTSIWPIMRSIYNIKKVQEKFIEALNNIKIGNSNPKIGKVFKNILVCDNNPIVAEEVAKNSVIRKRTLLYSGFQVGITFVNRLNDNIKDLNKKIDGLTENNTKLNEQINNVTIDNTKLNEQINNVTIDNIKLNGQINKLTDENKTLEKKVKEIEEKYNQLLKRIESVENSKENNPKMQNNIMVKKNKKLMANLIMK